MLGDIYYCRLEPDGVREESNDSSNIYPETEGNERIIIFTSVPHNDILLNILTSHFKFNRVQFKHEINNSDNKLRFRRKAVDIENGRSSRRFSVCTSNIIMVHHECLYIMSSMSCHLYHVIYVMSSMSSSGVIKRLIMNQKI